MLLEGVIRIADILFHSITGSMLSNVLHSVLLIHDEVLHSTSSLLMDLLKPLDRYNKHLHFVNDSAASKWNIVFIFGDSCTSAKSYWHNSEVKLLF